MAPARANTAGTLMRRRRCNGTIETCNSIDVREMTRRGMLDAPVGSAWRQCALRWPWLSEIRLNQASLELRLRSGHVAVVPLVWVKCGFIGGRLCLVRPCCQRHTRKLYEIGGACRCRVCGDLRYAMHRRSVAAGRVLTAQRRRLKIGGKGALRSLDNPDDFPTKPPRMHRKTYERARRQDQQATRKLDWRYWRGPDWTILVPR
jgi:hypothetical protein